MMELTRIVALLEEGRGFCLATVVVSRRPQAPAGSKAAVFADGNIEGSLGAADLDSALPALAAAAIAGDEKRTVELPGGVSAFLDVIPAAATLLICGAGHIAMPLARFALEAGFRVSVLDDRSDFANAARFPGCEVLADDFAAALRRLPLGPSTYAVVITRGHDHDAECLAEILPKQTAYVGMIGSRRRVRAVLESLGRAGIPAARLAEVFTPIGLPIGAESPEELALCIAAELVCVRRNGPSAARALRSSPGGGA